MQPRTEPNSIPALFTGWPEWRDTYTAYVAYFNASGKTCSDELHLRIRLKRLGFTGTNLETEIEHIKEQSA